jgi:dTDP-glucose 4,6-dehydratase
MTILTTYRIGLDRPYPNDATNINRDLGWKPAETIETCISETKQLYLSNPEWGAVVQSGAYKVWDSKKFEGAAA